VESVECRLKYSWKKIFPTWFFVCHLTQTYPLVILHCFQNTPWDS
jgi:hypothetical protein